MKILTLNTHSLAEENYSFKLKAFVNAVAVERHDIIALQEVNQTCSAGHADVNSDNYISCADNIVIKEDNHVYSCVNLLKEKGVHYYWTWLPVKKGYGKFDEGMALMSPSPIKETSFCTISGVDDYNNWRTRKILGIRTAAFPDEWFFSVHLGWWDDDEEPFSKQWKRLCRQVKVSGRVWLMGDFNNPSHIRGEGYDMIKSSGWYDTFELAKIKDNGITAPKNIDGWKEKNGASAMRIDQIWCSEKAETSSSQVIFNGRNYPVVSDHYGVEVNVE
ncbi:MAG: endonuclease/exonuclease/phosphatase family protein [Oscillospiraceae bacterium]|nr:endonuclease/exonuclease/phosphatase family protein [Oscillospiraceae bacterium]